MLLRQLVFRIFIHRYSGYPRIYIQNFIIQIRNSMDLQGVKRKRSTAETTVSPSKLQKMTDERDVQNEKAVKEVIETSGAQTNNPDIKAPVRNQDKNSSQKEATTQDQRHLYEYFWREKSPFSQWHRAEFKVDGVKYNCAEQFMMHRKAVLFKDDAIAKKILATPSPKTQKGLGRKVKNFDEKMWSNKSVGIVEEGNEAKFSQNPDLKKLLYSTHPRTLVEASPFDRVWGIGLAKENPLAWNKTTWKGKNLLGHALTKVRDKLMEKDGIRNDENK